VQNCTFNATGGAGVRVGYLTDAGATMDQAAVDTTIENCIFNALEGRGVDILKARSTVVRGCRFLDCTQFGIRVNNAPGSVVDGNYFKGCFTSVAVGSGSFFSEREFVENVTIANNRMDESGAISVSSNSKGISVLNNFLTQTTAAFAASNAIEMDINSSSTTGIDAQNVLIAGNVIVGFFRAISQNGVARNISIVNNQMQDNPGRSMVLGEILDVVIAGNRVDTGPAQEKRALALGETTGRFINNVLTLRGGIQRTTLGNVRVGAEYDAEILQIDVAQDRIRLPVLYPHSFPTVFRATVASTGDLPGGLDGSTLYYGAPFGDALPNAFVLYPTRVDALMETNRVSISDAGSGTVTFTIREIGDSNSWISAA
jgi:hypothetical protein